MGVANLLKEGILSLDWNKVKEAYSELTGEEWVEPDEESPILTEAEEGTEDEENGFMATILKSPKKSTPKVSFDEVTGETKNYGITTPINSKKIQAVGNLWDSDEYEGVVEKDSDIGITYPNRKKSKRPKAKMVDIKCRSCGKKYKVAPLFVRNGEYVCDKCIGRIRNG